jgi:probable rRNA maturation factor
MQKKSTIKLNFAIEKETFKSKIPSIKTISSWVAAVLTEPTIKVKAKKLSLEITIAFLSKKESARLNSEFRHKQGPTNILTFRDDSLVKLGLPIFADLLISLPVTQEEAKEQKKNLHDHLAHLIVHGLLHLFQYDHLTKKQREQMEKLEIKILKKLGIVDPYIG